MRYDAFISYRHADLDTYVAKKVHKGLETFRVPRAVTKKSGKKNIKRVFRDQEELPIGSDLGDNIEKALAESEYLLVICSPRTPESYWVQKEIATFIQMHDREHVLAILVEGEPNQSFPSQLLIDECGNPVEPLAADVRGVDKGEVNRKLKTEIMRLAAPLLSCSYDDLRQRHRERKMKKLAAVSGVVAALALAFGAYSTYNAAMIQRNLEGKQRNQSKYLADTSLALLEEGDRRAAVLVALEALPSEDNDRPYVAEAQYALSEALHCYDTGNVIRMDRVLNHDLPVSDFYMVQDGSRLVSIDQGGYVYCWDLDQGEKLAQIAPRINETGYIIEVENATVVGDYLVICDDKCIRSVDFGGKEIWCNEGNYLECEFDEEAGIAACVTGDEVIFWDITNGEMIAEMPNQIEASYSLTMAFNEDGTKFAVSHYMDEEDTVGYVSVYDFSSQSIVDMETEETYIVDIAFGEENDVVVASVKGFMTSDEEETLEIGYLQKNSGMTGEVLWTRDFQYDSMSYDSASVILKCRSYQDAETGEVHDEVLMTVDNAAYTCDSDTGELVTEVKASSGIESFLISVNSGYGYLAGNGGAIEIVNMTSGEIASGATIETGKMIRDVQIKNGVLAMRSYASCDITIMKYQEGMGMQMIEKYERSLESICYSTEESYYAVNLFAYGLERAIYFYRTEDNACVGMWSEAEDCYIEASGFIDDTQFVVVGSDGMIRYIDATSGTEIEVIECDKTGVMPCDMNDTCSMAFVSSGSQYQVIDVANQSICHQGDVGHYIHGGIISEDGKWAYCSVKEMGVCRIELETGEVEPIDLGEHYVLSSGEAQDAFAVSKDGKMLAISCEDGILRVVDVEKNEVVNEIPFASLYRRFIEFSADGTELMLQGDDYYFRVYNLVTEEYTHISTEQYCEIEEAVEDDVSDTISLITSADMIILNREDYVRVAQVEGGMAYLPKHSKILCNTAFTLYEFPYMTLEMLQEEAREQFGEDTLTEAERIKYHID